jgi:hypothetical protein
MATSVSEIGQEEGLSEAEIVGTALLTLTVATTLVGILTWLVGELLVWHGPVLLVWWVEPFGRCSLHMLEPLC